MTGGLLLPASLSAGGTFPGSPLEHYFPLDDHKSDQSIRRVRKITESVSVAVVGNDARIQLAREVENEIVGVRARRRLPDDALVYELLVAGRIVDLMPKRGIDDHDRLQALFGELLAYGENVPQLRLLALCRMRDV